MITQAIHLLIQVTINYTMSYYYSQNDNHIFTVIYIYFLIMYLIRSYVVLAQKVTKGNGCSECTM